MRCADSGTGEAFQYHNGLHLLAPNSLLTDPRSACFSPSFASSRAPRAGVFSALLSTAPVVAVALAGCSSSAGLREYVPQIVTPYRIDIQQGNFVTLDMVDKLQAGQTKDQVRFILGTPMLTDVFHQERWDFIFRSAKGWNDPEKRRLTVFFDKSEKLEKWEAVDVPKAVDVAAPVPEEPPGFFSRMMGGSSAAIAVPAASATPAAATPAAAPIAVSGAGNVSVAAPEPAPQPVRAQVAAAVPVAPEPAAVTPPPSQPGGVTDSASGADDKPGLFGRMFGWMRPGSGTAAAAAAAVPAAAVAVSAPASEAIALPPSAPVIAAAPTAVAQAVAAPVAAPAPPAAAPAPTPAPAATFRTVDAAAPAAASSPPSSASFEAPPAVRAAITAAIERWRQAWSSKNGTAYVASYEPRFKSTGLTRAEWEAQRIDRIKRVASINVTVSEIKMAQETDGAVAVSFVQKYESPTFKETGRKLLVFANYNGEWLIREESFLANSK